MTRGDCFATVHSLLFTVTFPGSGFMALVLAFDRLLAVYTPIRYLKFSRNYSIGLSIIGYSLVIPIFILSVIIVYGSTEYENVMVRFLKLKVSMMLQVSGTCEYSGAIFPTIVDVVRGARALATLLALFLYVPIIMKIRSVR